MSQIATLSSIYHKPPEAFVMKTLAQTSVEEDDYDDDLLGGMSTRTTCWAVVAVLLLEVEAVVG